MPPQEWGSQSPTYSIPVIATEETKFSLKIMHLLQHLSFKDEKTELQQRAITFSSPWSSSMKEPGQNQGFLTAGSGHGSLHQSTEFANACDS